MYHFASRFLLKALVAFCIEYVNLLCLFQAVNKLLRVSPKCILGLMHFFFVCNWLNTICKYLNKLTLPVV